MGLRAGRGAGGGMVMGWRIYPARWPNGREYWTVEDRASKPPQMRVGKTGRASIYYDKTKAQDEAKALRTPKGDTP